MNEIFFFKAFIYVATALVYIPVRGIRVPYTLNGLIALNSSLYSFSNNVQYCSPTSLDNAYAFMGLGTASSEVGYASCSPYILELDIKTTRFTFLSLQCSSTLIVPSTFTL